MNQQKYLEIRRELDLQTKPAFLWIYAMQTLVLMATCFAIYKEFPHSSLRFLAIPMISILMFRGFGFMHEAVHGLVAKNRRVNNLLGVISGGMCLLSYESWKQAHLEHHRWSGNLDKDPVMAMIKIFPTFPKRLQKVLTLGWNFWVPTLSFLQHTVFWSITVKHTLKKPQTLAQFLSVVFPIVLWTSLVCFLPITFTAGILLPGVFFYLIGTEIINAPHHLGLTYFRGETKIPLWEQFKTARSCVYPAWLARFVVMNFNYHSEHHMYPYVPWYHLDEIHRRVVGEIGSEYNLDPQFSWVRKNRALPLETVFGSSQVEEIKTDQAA